MRGKGGIDKNELTVMTSFPPSELAGEALDSSTGKDNPLAIACCC